MAMENGLGVADVVALSKDNDGFLGGSGGSILALIIVFILIFGNGGFGWGGNSAIGNYATQADIQRGFDNNAVVNKLDGIGNGICSLGYDQLGVMNGINTNIMQSANGINGGITELGYKFQQCCCESLRNDDKNTRDILEAIQADGQTTRALITENEMNRLRTDLQSAQLTLANASQTQNILNTLGRFVTNPPCYSNFSCGCSNGVTIA